MSSYLCYLLGHTGSSRQLPRSRGSSPAAPQLPAVAPQIPGELPHARGISRARAYKPCVSRPNQRAARVHTIPLARAIEGLGRPVPRECPADKRVTIPGYTRCPPPKRVLATVPIPGAKTPPRDATKAAADARAIEVTAKREASEAVKDATEATKVAAAATEQREAAERAVKIRGTPEYRAHIAAGVEKFARGETAAHVREEAEARERIEREAAKEAKHAEAEAAVARARTALVQGARTIQQNIRETEAEHAAEARARDDGGDPVAMNRALTESFPVNPCTGERFDAFDKVQPMSFRRRRWAMKLRECAKAPDLAGLGRTRPKGTKRCANAPKKLVKGCSEVTFRNNLRHLVCVGKKNPKQALAIAYSTLTKACGVKDKKRRSVEQIVAHGKRKKRKR